MGKRADGQGEGEERRVSRQWSKNASGNRRNVQVSETERMLDCLLELRLAGKSLVL